MSFSDILLIYPPHPFMLLQVAKFRSFVWLSSISVVFHLTHTHTHTHTPHLLYPFIHDGYFHVLVTVNKAAVNIGVHVSFQDSVFVFVFRYISRSGIAGSYGHSSFSFLRNFHAILHNAYTNLQSKQQWQRFLFLHILANLCYLWIFWW